MNQTPILFMLGAIAMASFVAGMFFLRFWKKTGERLFLLFALAFWTEGLNRTAFALLSANPREGEPWVYMVRLGTFLLILIGILDKNLRK